MTESKELLLSGFVLIVEVVHLLIFSRLNKESANIKKKNICYNPKERMLDSLIVGSLEFGVDFVVDYFAFNPFKQLNILHL